MWPIIAVMVAVVAGANYLIERSSLTKNMKSIARVGVLAVALSLTYYWLRTSA